MSWLSNFGNALKKAFTVESQYEPIVATALSAIPQTTAVAAGLNVFQGVVGSIESVFGGGGSGAQKLAAAAPIVQAAIENSGFLSGKKIADLNKYEAAVKAWTSAFVDVLNTLEPAAPTS